MDTSYVDFVQIQNDYEGNLTPQKNGADNKIKCISNKLSTEERLSHHACILLESIEGIFEATLEKVIGYGFVTEK